MFIWVILAFWILLGLGVFFVAFRGGRGRSAARQRPDAGGSRRGPGREGRRGLRRRGRRPLTAAAGASPPLPGRRRRLRRPAAGGPRTAPRRLGRGERRSAGASTAASADPRGQDPSGASGKMRGDRTTPRLAGAFAAATMPAVQTAESSAEPPSAGERGTQVLGRIAARRSACSFSASPTANPVSRRKRRNVGGARPRVVGRRPASP